MIKNLRKKGFTIVELVIVIAVIAILAAILIPTFSGIIKKANIASDTAMAKNMNTALVMADAEGNKAENMGDVLFTLYEAGYVLENLNPTTNGYYFVWDQESNQILFLTDTFEVHYSSQPYSEDTLNWWMPMDEASDQIEGQEFSYCMATDLTASFKFDYLANFDTNGFTLIGDISYDSTDTGSFNVSGIIKGDLTVDTINASVHHYGAIDNVEITQVHTASYHEHGFVRVTLNLVKGRLVIENSGSATAVTLPVVADGSAENNGYIGTLNVDEGDILIVNTGYIEATSGNENRPVPIGVGTPPAGYAILINNRIELEAFRDAVNAGMTCKNITVKLTQDIDLSRRYWIPIGYNTRENILSETVQPLAENVFKGTFDGNGKTIKGLSNSGYSIIDQDLLWENSANVTGYSYGFFLMTYNATIKNLNFTDVNIIINDNFNSQGIGAIVGVAMEQLVLTDCSVKGNINGQKYTGGAVGYLFVNHYATNDNDDTGTSVNNTSDYNADIIINNVIVEANINGSDRVGGIIGTVSEAWIYKDTKVIYEGTRVDSFTFTNNTFKGNITATVGRVAGLFALSSVGVWAAAKSGNSHVFKISGETASAYNFSNNTVNANITLNSSDVNYKQYIGRFTSYKMTSGSATKVPDIGAYDNNTFTGTVMMNTVDITSWFGTEVGKSNN